MSAIPAATQADGRTARRNRNSEAVLSATVDLVVEHHVLPSIEDVATRAGVSLRSIYRYFPDRRALLLTAIARQAEKAEPFWHLEHLGEGSLDTRVERYVAHRMHLYETLGPVIRTGLSLADELPDVTALVVRRRAQVRDLARAHFAQELDPLDPLDADAVLVCVDVLVQFDALDLLRRQQQVPRERCQAILARGVHAMLTASA